MWLQSPVSRLCLFFPKQTEAARDRHLLPLLPSHRARPERLPRAPAHAGSAVSLDSQHPCSRMRWVHHLHRTTSTADTSPLSLVLRLVIPRLLKFALREKTRSRLRHLSLLPRQELLGLSPRLGRRGPLLPPVAPQPVLRLSLSLPLSVAVPQPPRLPRPPLLLVRRVSTLCLRAVLRF